MQRVLERRKERERGESNKEKEGKEVNKWGLYW